MAYKETLEQLRAKLGENKAENTKFLREESMKFARENNYEGIRAVSELMLENLTDEEKAEIDRITHLDGLRLDKVYDQIVELMNKKDMIEAKNLAEKLYKKIILDYAPTDRTVYMSLRNPLEDNLCRLMFKTEKILNRAPFDFSAYLTAYAYIMVETGSTVDAIPVLEKASEYNPVDVGPKFELCEIYKITRNKKMVLQTAREILRIAISPAAIARAYANIGYALVNSGDYEDAVIFYVASTMFAPHPAVPLEMKHLADLMGRPIVKPSQEKIEEVMGKYDIKFGPNREVISAAAQLASKFLQEGDIPNALPALKITYNLTLDEEVKKIILKYEPIPRNNFARPNPNIVMTSGNNNSDDNK